MRSGSKPQVVSINGRGKARGSYFLLLTLAILLGPLGIHDFLMGRKVQGFVHVGIIVVIILADIILQSRAPALFLLPPCYLWSILEVVFYAPEFRNVETKPTPRRNQAIILWILTAIMTIFTIVLSLVEADSPLAGLPFFLVGSTIVFLAVSAIICTIRYLSERNNSKR